MAAQQRKILNVALDEALLKTRSAILAGAGYEVVPALNILEVEAACKKYRSFDLVIIGSTLPKFEKRRAMSAVRNFCGLTPILELYPQGTTPVDEEADAQLPSPEQPNVLLAKVSKTLAKKRKKRQAAS